MEVPRTSVQGDPGRQSMFGSTLEPTEKRDMHGVTFLGLLLFASGFLYLGVPYVYIKWLRYRQDRRMKTQSYIALTFDDGPGFRLTPAILDLLSEHGVRATFFVLGRNVQGRENLVRAAADRGHEIGTHSYDHLHSWKVWPTRAIADIRRGQDVLRRLLKTEDVFPFRPPCGKVNLFTLLFLLCKRIPICMWTLDTRDTWPAESRDGEAIAEALRRSGGAISLAHDFDRTGTSVDDYVLTTLRTTLKVAKEAGIRFVTVTELLDEHARVSGVPVRA
ncbi:MAG TPA: polysaccharide deacetylase family protein [Sedimentisphaerales bacterium]|nr:polysaccharide deacetylase family protein [Sedimentisphaerales bacterium]